MSDAIDIIEHMFEYEGMQTAAALRSPTPDRGGRSGAARGGGAAVGGDDLAAVERRASGIAADVVVRGEIL